jgi:2-methylisocitrate lyase-like PEP mutase family enzyme
VINVPGALPQARLAELGVARVSFGPWTQRVVLSHLAGLADDLLAGGALPDGIEILN